MNKQCAICGGEIGRGSQCLNCGKIDTSSSAPITNKRCPHCGGEIGGSSQYLNSSKSDISSSAPMSTEESNSTTYASIGVNIFYLILISTAMVKFGAVGLMAMGLCVAILVLISKTSKPAGLVAAVILIPVTVLIAAALSEIVRNIH